MDPEEYFASLEPDPIKRDVMVSTLRYILNPRTDEKSIVIIHGGERSGKTTLIKLLMAVKPHQSLELHPEDVTRVWRLIELRKSYPLRFVRIVCPGEFDLHSLPMLSNEAVTVQWMEPLSFPTFRYLIELQSGQKLIPSYHIIRIYLSQKFPDINNKVNVDIAAMMDYLEC